MSLLTVLLSIVLVLNAAFLILLILIQLPKKEAGAGLAFGAGATDALFGAGSGNALTKVTKYTATVFLVLVLGLSILGQRIAQQGSRGLEMELKKRASTPSAMPLTTTPNATVTVPPAATNIANTNLLSAPTNANAAAPTTTPAPTTPNNATPAPAPQNSEPPTAPPK
jgi:protein translocase SecG subunit